MVKKVHIFLVGVLLLPFGCKKKDNPMPVEETDPSVYVAGVIYTDRYQGCVWQDGEPQLLSDGENDTGAWDVYVTGDGDVYALCLSSSPSIYSLLGRVWKNGELVYTDIDEAFFYDIDGENNDVYIAGAKYVNGVKVATLWKNGNEISLPRGTTNKSSALGIDVNNGKVVVVGYEKVNNKWVATLWRDNNVIHLADSLQGSEALAVKIKDNNVYTVGYIFHGLAKTAMLWKDRTPIPLTAPDIDAKANDIFIDGNDIYICGSQRINNYYRAAYWKNGTLHVLADTTVELHSAATSIYIYNGDIYITGHLGSFDTTLKFWKNGEEVTLEYGEGLSMANDVIVK